MDVKVDKVNEAFLSLMQNPNQLITLDANFFLLPNRYNDSKLNVPDMPMVFWITNWLDPLFSCFQNLAIHEAVNDEIFSGQAGDYVNAKLTSIPPTLFLHKDSQLSPEELIIRNTKEALIAQNTKYIPELDNKDDRGEVKTLAYISTKNLIYFASHDDNALKLIKNCEELKTSLDEQKAIHMYELLYFLYKKGKSNRKYLKAIYKIQYHLTKHEKDINLEWGKFIEAMDAMYGSYFSN